VLLVALLGAYILYALYPAFLDELEVRTTLHSVANEGWHRKGREDMHRQVMDKLATIGFHLDTVEEGPPVQVRGIGVAEEDVVITCTDRSQDCSDNDGKVLIEVHYERVMPLPWLTGKSVTLKFNPHAEATLATVAW
jgi:hypothetical protein